MKQKRENRKVDMSVTAFVRNVGDIANPNSNVNTAITLKIEPHRNVFMMLQEMRRVYTALYLRQRRLVGYKLESTFPGTSLLIYPCRKQVPDKTFVMRVNLQFGTVEMQHERRIYSMEVGRYAHVFDMDDDRTKEYTEYVNIEKGEPEYTYRQDAFEEPGWVYRNSTSIRYWVAHVASNYGGDGEVSEAILDDEELYSKLYHDFNIQSDSDPNALAEFLRSIRDSNWSGTAEQRIARIFDILKEHQH